MIQVCNIENDGAQRPLFRVWFPLFQSHPSPPFVRHPWCVPALGPQSHWFVQEWSSKCCLCWDGKKTYIQMQGPLIFMPSPLPTPPEVGILAAFRMLHSHDHSFHPVVQEIYAAAHLQQHQATLPCSAQVEAFLRCPHPHHIFTLQLKRK